MSIELINFGAQQVVDHTGVYPFCFFTQARTLHSGPTHYVQQVHVIVSLVMASLDQHNDGPRSSSSEDGDDDDVEDTWDDVDDENVSEVFTSLFDDRTFEDVKDMFTYCKDQYGFDVWQLQQQHDLDFLGLVKLVNYVRKSVSQGRTSPDVSSKALFDDDLYLLPAMESDTVLYNLEDILVQARTVAQSQIEECR